MMNSDQVGEDVPGVKDQQTLPDHSAEDESNVHVISVYTMRMRMYV